MKSLNIEETIKEIEEMLKEKGLIEEEVKPEKPIDSKCQWCEYKVSVLNYHQHCYEDGSFARSFSGWFCPECAWLSSCALEACENDKS